MPCKDCLVQNKNPVRFSGNPEGKILFLFDGPAPYEKKLEMPEILKRICKFLRFPLDDVFVASAHRCYFDKENFTGGKINTILENCRDSLNVVLKEVKPKMIVCFGALAFQTAYKKSTLKKARNQFFFDGKYHIAVTYNPYAAHKDPAKLPSIQADLANILRYMNNGYKVEDVIEYKEVETIRPILDGDCFKEGNFYITGIDTEGSGVKWYDPNDVTISYQVSKNTSEGWTVILHEECEKDKGDFNIFVPRGGTKKDPIMVEIGVKKAKGFERKIEELKELLSRNDFKKYFFNQKFEMHHFMNLGITEFNNCCIDARVLAHTLDSNRHKNCSLDDLISEYTTYSSHKGAVTDIQKSDMFGLLKNDRKTFIKYASLDPVMTLIVTQQLKKEIFMDEKSLNYFVKFAQPIENELLFQMERNGVLVDKKAIPELKKKIKAEMETKLFEFKDKCPPKVYERHKDNFKLTRPIIIQESLFKWADTKLRKNQEKPEIHDYGFNLVPIEINKASGLPGTDKKKIMSQILEGKYSKKVKNLISIYLEYKELSNLLGNFLKNIELHLDAKSRLHASFSLTFTTSGRVASRSPSLMNIPKHSKTAKYLRELFIPEEDYTLAEKDFAAAEVRFVGQQCKDAELVRVLNAGTDMHAFTAKKVNGLPETYEFKDEKERKHMRQTAKAITFALLYLAKPSTLQVYAKQNYGVTMSMKKANEFFDMFFSLYPGIRRWHEKDKAFLEKHGYLRTMFGRKQILPNVFSSDNGPKQQAIRTGINSMIQGPSSDYALLGAYYIMNDPTIDHKRCYITLFLHDALYFAIHKDYLYEALPKLKYHMENVPIEELFGVKPVVPFLTETTLNKDNLASGVDIDE
jgi:DNA polymerase I-like protein with 3'-5' exonuclease and polymerase domains/uracil-DNA glycosylase